MQKLEDGNAELRRLTHDTHVKIYVRKLRFVNVKLKKMKRKKFRKILRKSPPNFYAFLALLSLREKMVFL